MPQPEDPEIFSAQLDAYFSTANTLNLSGAVVITLIVAISVGHVPTWTWLPPLLLVYAVTIMRSYLFWQYRRHPLARTPQQCAFYQTLWAALAGLGWGFATTAMNCYETVNTQIIIAAIAAVASAASAVEGFTFPQPSRAFIVITLTPLVIQLLLGHTTKQPLIGMMLAIFAGAIIAHANKHNRAFIETLKLRFQNEHLVASLDKQRQIAEEANDAKSRFLAAASHDLRQPVQALAIFHSLMRAEATLTAKGEHYFARSTEALNAVGNLLDSLLDISKLDSNTVKCEPQPVLMNNILNEMRREFAQSAEEKNIRLRIVRSSVCIETDPVLLGQVLRNYISNALKYTGAGTILIGCRRHKTALTVQVWDTGIGIAPEHQQAIFREFYQIANRERDRQNGLGLGLAIVERAAKLLGATVCVKSTPGRGSCFSITLPLQEKTAHALPTVAPDSIPLDSDLSGRLIVFIENEMLIRKGIQELLQNWGNDVISAESWEDAYRQIRAQDKKIDALISDYGLPGKENGIQIIQNSSARLGYACACLLITGDTSVAVSKEANAAGIKVLYKPVDPSSLRMALNEVLG